MLLPLRLLRLKIRRPRLYQCPPLVEQVAPGVRRLDPVPNRVRQCRLHHGVRRVRLFGHPVVEAGPKPVRHRGEAKFA